MAAQKKGGLPFRRGADRRVRSGNAATDRRQRPMDRRGQGFGWLQMFRGADETAVLDAIGECEVLVLPAGATLLRQGEANSQVFLVLSGELSAYLDSTMPPDSAIPILPGETVGELSAIDGKPVSALVVARTAARVLRLPGETFWNRLTPVPGVARNLLGALAERTRKSNRIMLEAQRRQLALDYLRKELEVARQLQASMLPLRRPLFPARGDVEAAGLMEPASEIGGDLFDAFFVDDQRLFVCVGDVSGHGIPAALFMARTIGLLRVAAMGMGDPGRLLGHINDQLCSGNEANIFVTLFLGFLDLASGRLTYSNGGHLAPLLTRSGRIVRLPIPRGALVGAMPGLCYTSAEIRMEEGDLLVCFTDGITEAEAGGEEFSEERLQDVVAAHAHRPLEGLLDEVRRQVSAFIGDRPPADDCTLLAVRRPLRAPGIG